MEHRIHLLLVEDDPDSELLLSLQLNEACGSDVRFTMESASRLEDGLRRLREDGSFSLLLLDLHLPDSNGLETVARAKACGAEVPIIVLTSSADERLALEALAAGAQDFLVKDRLEPRALRRALSYALQRATAARVEQLEAEIAERRRIDAAKDQVLAKVSHELRAPLTITRAAVANLFDGLAGALGEEQRKLAIVALRNLERLSRMINNFLDLSRLESGRAKIEPKRVDCRALLQEAVQGARVADREGRLTWEFDAPAELPHARVDPDLFVELVANLLDNAARFARGRVLLRAEASGEELIVSVEDDGQGVPPEQASRLFRPYVQAERRAAAGYKGTGLGLSICREIARLSGGRIWLERAEPEGARFRFSMPLWGAEGERHGRRKPAQGADRR